MADLASIGMKGPAQTHIQLAMPSRAVICTPKILFSTRSLYKYPKLRTRNSHLTVCAASTKDDHNATQAAYFAKELKALQDSITDDIHAQLQRIADSVPGLSAQSRVLDAGAGDGVLIPHLQARGVAEVLAVDVCPEMISELHRKLGQPTTQGNAPGIRTWVGDVTDLPAYQGPFDAIYFNAVFGNLWDQREALIRAVNMMRPGSHLVISHPLGRKWHEEYCSENPEVVPHTLPTKSALESLIFDVPLQITTFIDDDSLYLVVLQVPEGYAHPRAPIYLSGAVTTGFGRGSRQLGVPTANLPPENLKAELDPLPTGVYFGWACVDPPAGAPAVDSGVHKMVMNIGRRPTFEDKDPEVSVELHVMHPFEQDFYGCQMRAVVLGFIRPEVKFNGLQELLARIRTDIGIAKSQLDGPKWTGYIDDPFLKTNK